MNFQMNERVLICRLSDKQRQKARDIRSRLEGNNVAGVIVADSQQAKAIISEEGDSFKAVIVCAPLRSCPEALKKACADAGLLIIGLT